MKCHCGNEAIEGFNLADICQPCFEAWERAGEPEECPCAEVHIYTCVNTRCACRGESFETFVSPASARMFTGAALRTPCCGDIARWVGKRTAVLAAVAFDDFASVHAAFCADVAGCTETAPCHPCAYWMARAYGKACPACAQTGLPLSSRVAAMPQ